MTKIRFDTTPYEASHGRKPRGRGNWAFTTHRHFADGDIRTYWGRGTYTEAKCDAARQLRADNKKTVNQRYVLYLQP